jgi:hypothetical protein
MKANATQKKAAKGSKDPTVKVVSRIDSPGHETVYLDTSSLPVPVRRGRRGSGSTSPLSGDSITFINTTKHQVTLTFCEDDHNNHSKADLEFPENPLVLGHGDSGIETLTDKREGKGRQEIWVRIAWRGLAPGSGGGGGPDMGIDDPAPNP